MKNARIIKEIIDNNVIAKQERMPVGASIARPHSKVYAIAGVGAISNRPLAPENCLKEKHNQAGITLIALIITIIILLILASITINLTLGERGIFNTAKKAGENYKEAEERELAELNNFEQETYNVINNIGNITTKQPVKQKLYLYNYGESCEDITGGWTTKWEDASNGAGTNVWNRGTMKLDTTNSDKMVFTATSTNGYTGAVLTTINKIDLTNYSTLNIQYGNLYVGDSLINHKISAAISKNGYDYYYSDKGMIWMKDVVNGFTNVTNHSNSVLQIDVSEIKEGYIAPLMLTDVNDYGQRTSFSAEVYKVWLE